MLKKELYNLIKKAVNSLAKQKNWPLPKDLDIPLITSFNPTHGDYNTPLALILSKTIK